MFRSSSTTCQRRCFWTKTPRRHSLASVCRRRLLCERLEDRRLLSIDLVSATGAILGNGDSHNASISADGRYVAFNSEAANLVDGDTNGVIDVFVKDLTTGVVTRASVNQGGQEGNGGSDSPSISADGRYLAFCSRATNLVPGANGIKQVFVKDLQTGAVTLASTNAVSQQGNNDSFSPCISPEGGWVTFTTYATNFASNPYGAPQVFAKHLFGLTETKLVSADNLGTIGNNTSGQPCISQGGHYVTFCSYANNLVADDTNGTEDIFVKDLVTNGITRVNTSSLGLQGNGMCEAPRITSDGRYVVFWSEASNLVPSDANGALRDICVKDLQTGAIRLANTSSTGHQSTGALADHPDISDDGRYVTFETYDRTLVSGDTNSKVDVFVKDLQTGKTTRVSLGSTNKQANSDCVSPVISDNGRWLAFESQATNLVASKTSTLMDIFRVSNSGMGLPTVSIQDATPVVEGNLGTTEASFTVSLSTATDHAVTVKYATFNGTAKLGKDYTIARGTVTFAPEEVAKTVTVLILGDTTDEIDETFRVTLNNPKGATIAGRTATGTILDDDDPPAIAINDITVTEGRATRFTATLSAASSKTVSVHYATADQTAVVGSDYRMIPDKLLKFFPGQTKKTITVTTVNDKVHEDPETFLLTLFTPENGTLPRPAGICTILDNDPLPPKATSVSLDGGRKSASVDDPSLAAFLDAATRRLIGTSVSSNPQEEAVDAAIRLLMMTS